MASPRRCTRQRCGGRPPHRRQATGPAIDARDRQVGGRAVAHPLLVELGIAAGADLLVDEQVHVVDQAVFLAQRDQRHIVGHHGRLVDDADAREVARFHVGLGHLDGGHGGVDLALAQRQEDVGLALVGAELARAPFLDLAFQPDRLIGAGGGADGLSLHVRPRRHGDLVVGHERVFERVTGDREAHGLGAFQRVRGRGDGHVDPARHQRGDAFGEGGLDDLGGHAQRGGQIVAIVDVKADRRVAGVARPHRREVQHHRAAQNARADDLVQLVGPGRHCESGHGQHASRKNRSLPVSLPVWLVLTLFSATIPLAAPQINRTNTISIQIVSSAERSAAGPPVIRSGPRAAMRRACSDS